jgi:subtilisin family serine protease
VISVGASISNTGIADYSNYGSFVDVYAPGNTLALTKVGNLISIWGTSPAAVLVSALAGLIWKENPDFTTEQVRDTITCEANTTSISSGDKTGRLINCLAAIQFTQQCLTDTTKTEALIELDEIGNCLSQNTNSQPVDTSGSLLPSLRIW